MADAVNHTPGPWELVSLSGYGSPFSVRMAYIATSAKPDQTHYGVQSIRRREDAVLISAAPDLLVAVQRCLNFIEGTEAELGEEFECGNLARAAIAKATGAA